MKKFLLLFTFCLVAGMIFGQSRRSKTELPTRAENKNAITALLGWKSLNGIGLSYTRYVTPKLGIDIGMGLGTQLLRGGVRARYIFMEKAFSPTVGLGIVINPLSITGVAIDEGVNPATVDINSNIYLVPMIGYDLVTRGGFTLTGAVGYQLPITTPFEAQTELSSDEELALRIIYGRGLIFEGSIGYAF